MRAAIVVPTIRENNIISFMAAWGSEFVDHLVIVVEDNPERTFDISGVERQPLLLGRHRK